MHKPNELSTEEARFVEQIAVLISEGGLPPSVGRVLGLLLVCEPQQQSAEDMQQLLRLSSGAVSGAVGVLMQIQLVERVSLPGSRKFYYRLRPDCWQRLLQARLQQLERGTQIVRDGLTQLPNNERLSSLLALYEKSLSVMQSLKL